MATLVTGAPEQVEPELSMDEAVRQLNKIVEGYYDDIGLSEAERDERYASAKAFLDSKDAASATV